VLFMGGVLGRLFREFSVTICVAILISGVVSVTLTPMLCSRFLKGLGHGKANGTGEHAAPDAAPHAHGRFYEVTEQGFKKLLDAYDRSLQVVLRHRPATMLVFVIVLALTGALFVIVPKGFIPDQDTDQIQITTEAAQGTGYSQLVEYQNQVSEIVRDNPNV